MKKLWLRRKKIVFLILKMFVFIQYYVSDLYMIYKKLS